MSWVRWTTSGRASTRPLSDRSKWVEGGREGGDGKRGDVCLHHRSPPQKRAHAQRYRGCSHALAEFRLHREYTATRRATPRRTRHAAPTSTATSSRARRRRRSRGERRWVGRFSRPRGESPPQKRHGKSHRRRLPPSAPPTTQPTPPSLRYHRALPPAEEEPPLSSGHRRVDPGASSRASRSSRGCSWSGSWTVRSRRRRRTPLVHGALRELCLTRATPAKASGYFADECSAATSVRGAAATQPAFGQWQPRYECTNRMLEMRISITIHHGSTPGSVGRGGA